MAGRFGDLELLMDHNIKSVGRVKTPSFNEASPSPVEEKLQLQQQSSIPANFTDEALPQNQQCIPSFASLSLASAPLLYPTLNFNSNVPLYKARQLDPPSAKMPSQKKCISPMPVMPAISASTLTGASPASVSSPSVSVKNKKFSTAFPDYLRLPDKDNGFGNPNDAGALRKASIVWFRNDLRCHDNEALATASKESLSILPVYIFDARDYGKSSTGFDKTGSQRTKFIMQCVADLRDKLKELGSDLIIRIGKPEEVLVNLAKAIGADALYAHKEISHGDMVLEKKVTASLSEEGVETKFFWGNTLFHVDDLPFKLEDMPATYGAYREKVANVQIRQAIETPRQLKGLPIRGGVKLGDMPTLEELGVKSSPNQMKVGAPAATLLVGGEKEALQRLSMLVKEHAKLSSNKSNGTEDSLYGSNFSAKISPWLTLGCLSPKKLLEEFKSSEISASMKSNSSKNGPNWLVFELQWRDFFRFITSKHSSSRICTEATVVVPA